MITSRISAARRRELESIEPGDLIGVDKHDLAILAYEKDLALYHHEVKRWAEVWREAGKEPPPCPAIKPKEPARPHDLDCTKCSGSGTIEQTCECCGGTGNRPEKRRSA